MGRLILVLLLSAFVAASASARHDLHPARDVTDASRIVWFWFDDLEPEDAGWAHGDFTAVATPHFHVSTYMAYARGHSWWCGTFDYDADGGYGNSWDDRLDVPPVITAVEPTSWSAIKARYRESPAPERSRDPIYPVITLAYRNDTEPGYDFTYVDAESAGAFVHLNRGFDGVHPWGMTGFYLGNKDSPYVCRMRFVSDGAWSDEDGDYLSVGGACMFDEIMVWDYYSGTVYFYDDVESGGLCMPSVPGAAGDYWHILENSCKAWSDPHCWANAEPDTPGFVPPGVQNWLTTPMVNLSNAATCTTYFVIQFFTPTVDNDYWTEEMTTDGGVTWTQLHAWWGDQCDSGYGPCDHFGGIADDVSSLLPGTLGAHRWTYHTTDNGAGPDVCGCAGITLDDIGFYGHSYLDRGATGWGRVRSLFK